VTNEKEAEYDLHLVKDETEERRPALLLGLGCDGQEVEQNFFQN